MFLRNLVDLNMIQLYHSQEYFLKILLPTTEVHTCSSMSVADLFTVFMETT